MATIYTAQEKFDSVFKSVEQELVVPSSKVFIESIVSKAVGKALLEAKKDPKKDAKKDKLDKKEKLKKDLKEATSSLEAVFESLVTGGVIESLKKEDPSKIEHLDNFILSLTEAISASKKPLL